MHSMVFKERVAGECYISGVQVSGVLPVLGRWEEAISRVQHYFLPWIVYRPEFLSLLPGS